MSAKSHLLDSNQRPELYESSALPTELRWPHRPEWPEGLQVSAHRAPKSTAGRYHRGMQARACEDWSDERLAQEVGRGDRAAAAELVTRYQRRVYGICRGLVGDAQAADLAQDSLLRVLTKIETFSGESELSTWVYRVTTNTCLTWLRRQKRNPVRGGIDGERAGNLAGRELSERSGVEQSEQVSRLSRAMARLADEHRAIIVLRDVRGLEYEELAAVLDVPPGTVRSRLFRARKALREQLEKD